MQSAIERYLKNKNYWLSIVHTRDFHNSEDFKNNSSQNCTGWTFNSFSKDNEKAQREPQKNERPYIIDTDDGNWAFRIVPVLCLNEFSSHEILIFMHAKWHVKAFPVPLFFNKPATGCKMLSRGDKIARFRMDVRQFNFVSCNCAILVWNHTSDFKSHLWFPTKLHSTQLNYHRQILSNLFQGMTDNFHF